MALTISKVLERFWLLLTSWSCENANWVFQRVTNKFLDYNMLLNCLSLLNIEIHNANKGQTTAAIYFYKVLNMDKWLLQYLWEDWLGSAQRRQIVSLRGTVGETGIFHYCFPSVKSDLFSYLVLATETNHALIYFPLFFWLHNHLERTLQMIYSASDQHNSAKRLE